MTERELQRVNLPESLHATLLVEGVAHGFIATKDDDGLGELIVDGRAFVRFAPRGPFGSFCLDPFTGFVVHVVHPPRKPPTHPTFVNTSIVFFNRTVEAVLLKLSLQRKIADDNDDDSLEHSLR